MAGSTNTGRSRVLNFEFLVIRVDTTALDWLKLVSGALLSVYKSGTGFGHHQGVVALFQVGLYEKGLSTRLGFGCIFLLETRRLATATFVGTSHFGHLNGTCANDGPRDLPNLSNIFGAQGLA